MLLSARAKTRRLSWRLPDLSFASLRFRQIFRLASVPAKSDLHVLRIAGCGSGLRLGRRLVLDRKQLNFKNERGVWSNHVAGAARTVRECGGDKNLPLRADRH